MRIMTIVALLTAGVLAAFSAADGFASGAEGGGDSNKAAANDARRSPPNVVLILSDDQAWNDYSYLGHPHIRTPHIDRLAAQGLRFDHGYVPSSLCRASLASIITGLFPHQHFITSNDPPLPKGKRGGQATSDPQFLRQRQEMIDYIEKSPTLPRLLARQGYLSFQAGKWWEGNYRRGGFTHGMTHGDPQRGGRHGDDGLKIGRQGMQPVLDFVDMALEQQRPFFLWYAPMMPHSPHNPPERLLSYYRERAPTLEIARYWAMCEWFDETCGELLGHLDRRGIADDTLVIYCADNGWLQDPDADRYLERSKRSPYDGGIRTPMLVRWPGRVPPQQSGDLVSTVDIAPTVLAAAGQSPTADMPGLDLLDAEARRSRRQVTGAIYEHNAIDIHRPGSSLQYRWIVEDGWKLILPGPQAPQGAATELFRLTDDPWEQEDLAQQHPQQVAKLRAALDAWLPLNNE